jgi:transforming growth factor-beta-induced protein
MQGPFTVLAPVNSAFGKLDPTFVQQYLQPSMFDKLRAILLHHILPKYRPVISFTAGETATLLDGTDVTITVAPLRFGTSAVVTADIEACNGIIHSIETVHIPTSLDFCDDCTCAIPSTTNCTDMLERAESDPILSTLVDLLNVSGLNSIFECKGPFTALLPSNNAFEKLSGADLKFLSNPANRDVLRDVLLYHLLPNSTQSSKFTSGPRNTLLPGEQVDIQLSPLRFDDAVVKTHDIETCQGIINIVDNVLLPFVLPFDECVEYTFNQRGEQLQDAGRDCDWNVIDVAKQNSDLTIVTTLFDIAGLTPIFSCTGPFTAIFPSNTAFDDVPTAFLDNLVLPQNINRLRDVLLYHIVPGSKLTSAFIGGLQDTLTDGKIDVTLKPLEFNGFSLFKADITACNGYVNIVSGLLNPFGKQTMSSVVDSTS